jgi:hypothetical protein
VDCCRVYAFPAGDDLFLGLTMSPEDLKAYSTFFQVLSGSNLAIALAIFAVSFPKSF